MKTKHFNFTSWPRRMACMAIVMAALQAQAQKVGMNDGWQFVRLDATSAKAWTAGQQGTDWQSQFDVQHGNGNGQHARLALTDSVITSERQALGSAAWEAVRLPHTAKIEPYTIVHPWQGVGYYRRQVSIPAKHAGDAIWIEFEGAMQLADIWINGRHVTQHAGGFTSFVVDATGYLHEGENTLLVRLDNRDNALIPPGKPLSKLDFCYHSGLYRDVSLIFKRPVHITHPLLSGTVAGGGIFVTYPTVTAERALVDVKTEVENTTTAQRQLRLRQTLYEWTRRKGIGRKVMQQQTAVSLPQGTKQSVTQQLTVDNPQLWSPDSPHLYVLRTEVLDGGKVVDSEDTRIGIRRFEVTREGCFINGKRVELDGGNRHQEYPYVGNAVSDAAHYRDMWQMKAFGLNTVRLGHYPQDPAVLDACDELGLLAIEPIPGWQFFNRDPLFTALTYSDIQQMIRRDRNHPAILMWETTLNESWPPTAWKDGAVQTAHAEMPAGMCITSGDSYGYNGFDVCYNDWSDKNFNRPNNSTKPSFIREYYDYEFGGHYSTSRITLGDGERALRQNLWNLQWSLNSNRTTSTHTMGGAVWSMYDYNRGSCDNICYSGMADLFRRPKYSLYLFRTQMAEGTPLPDGPMPYDLFVASRWDEQSSDTVIVLGNVAEVALRVNGNEVARQRADKGAKTPYSQQTNFGNCDRLQFPPFVFKGVPKQAGHLEVIGYDEAGREVARQTVITPEAPANLTIDYFEGGCPARRNDLLIVYARLTDSHGTPCHTNGTSVTLDVEGGKVMGPATTETEDGVASFIVSTDNVSALRLNARSGSMTAKRSIKLKK